MKSGGARVRWRRDPHGARDERRVARRSQRGITLVEIVIGLAIIGIIASMGFARFNGWIDAQHARGAARDIADAFTLARTEAIRTGNPHVVLFGITALTGVDGAGLPVDPLGTPLQNDPGEMAPIVVVNDANGNCSIDPGETTVPFPAKPNINWDVSTATVRAPNDTGGVALGTGSTFASPANPATPIPFVLFRAGDGVPVAFTGSAVTGCGTIGTTGSGSGSIYVTDGKRDYATTLAPMGGVRVHTWDSGTNTWTN
ncbi:MAG: prepilin-type N-terminal cleavage/methylation domain-containing protein [Myxococcales bacterium]|nr:prepilin-type N-terminal cleavage/methylation domain-containing protein [Myxococcales bacterium]